MFFEELVKTIDKFTQGRSQHRNGEFRSETDSKRLHKKEAGPSLVLSWPKMSELIVWISQLIRNVNIASAKPMTRPLLGYCSRPRNNV